MGLKKLIKSAIRVSKEKEVVPIVRQIEANKMFEGKTALISGATGGIGLAICEELLDKGCKIIAGGTNKTKLAALEDRYSQDVLRTVVFDYNDPNSFRSVINEALQIFSGLDILICSAGVHTENVNLWDITSEEYSRVLDINLKGTYFSCLEFAKYMRDNRRKGHILIISSSRGSEPAWSPYGVSKWGLKGITEGFAKVLLPYGVTVNAIAPGSTATELIGYKEGDSIFSFENSASRLIMPEEVASLAAYLVSESANMITGETIHISAGRGLFDIR